MGEYAKYPKNSDNEIKIGTCSSMYYLRYEQRRRVKPIGGNVNPAAQVEQLTFRLPVPSEDHTKPGQFEYNGFYGVDATNYRIVIDDNKLLTEINAFGLQKPGIVQIQHRDAGFLCNFPCYHGQPQALPKGLRYNGFNSHTLALFGFGIRDNEPCILIGCYLCGKAICWLTLAEIEKAHFVRDQDDYKTYLINYMLDVQRELDTERGC